MFRTCISYVCQNFSNHFIPYPSRSAHLIFYLYLCVPNVFHWSWIVHCFRMLSWWKLNCLFSINFTIYSISRSSLIILFLRLSFFDNPLTLLRYFFRWLKFKFFVISKWQNKSLYRFKYVYLCSLCVFFLLTNACLIEWFIFTVFLILISFLCLPSSCICSKYWKFDSCLTSASAIFILHSSCSLFTILTFVIFLVSSIPWSLSTGFKSNYIATKHSSNMLKLWLLLYFMCNFCIFPVNLFILFHLCLI